MVKIRWFWEWEGVTHQVELRHGRRSGIRKVYVDKQLLEREKSFKNMLSDTGSQHEFVVGNKRGEILIVPKGTSGFLYQLKIDGQAIEQNLVRRPAPRTPAAAPLPRATVSVRAQRVRLSPRDAVGPAPERPRPCARPGGPGERAASRHRHAADPAAEDGGRPGDDAAQQPV